MALVGATALFEYVSSVDLGIDTLLMFDRPWGRGGTLAPGRMGLPGALSWTLAGTALALLRYSARVRALVSVIGTIVTAMALLSLTGYLFRADVLFAVPAITTIAVQTAMMVFVVGIGLVFAVPDRHPARGVLESGAAGVLIRRTIPFVVVVPIVLGLLRLAGEWARFYDTAMGTAMLVLALIGLFCGVLWWAAAAVRRHELRVESTSEAARTAIAMSEERYRSLVSIITDIPYTADVTGEFIAPQVAWSTFTGQSWQEARGFGWVNALHPDDREVVRGTWDEACRTGHGYHSRGRLWRAASHEYRYFEARATPITNSDGSVREWVGACTDVTEQRRIEDAQLAAARQKDEFIAVLAHELRNPLAPIRTSIALLRAKGPSEPLLVRCHDVIDRQVAYMGRLLDDLLDVSRLSRGKLTLQRGPVVLRDALDAAIEINRPLIDRQCQDLTVECPRETILIDGDEARLTQILGNVLNNAAKYSATGAGILVSVRLEQEMVAVVVRDEGLGIAEDMLERIFELFAQSDDARHNSAGGLGIGLSLARRLAEMHGGTILASSAGLGRGSEFVVRLPVMPCEPPRLADSALGVLKRLGAHLPSGARGRR